MTRKALWLAALTAALVLALGVNIAQGAISDIFGSDHDLGSPGSPTCAQCHTPHKAQGMYLWAMAPSTIDGTIDPSLQDSVLFRLCFSCHDGSIGGIVGQWIPYFANHPMDPSEPGGDCDRCHDAHEGDSWKFTRTIPGVEWANANLCAGCHEGDIGVSHPIDVLTNLPIDRRWDPNAYPQDFSGTRLFNQAGTAWVPSGDAYIKCATCHVPHGGTGTAMNTMTYAAPDSSHSPICENCHQ